MPRDVRFSAIDVLQDRPVGQIGIVVTDLERRLRSYGSLWGIGPWALYTYGPGFVPRLVYRGAPGTYSMRIPLAGSSPQVELIEPTHGPSIYHEHLERHGEGLHHVGVYVPSLDEAVASLEARGYELLQLGQGYGLDADGGYAYFDTVHDFGLLIEVIEVPHRRRQPESIWPAA